MKCKYTGRKIVSPLDMSENKASERTKKWMEEHPGRALVNAANCRLRKQRAQKESIKALKKAKYNTMGAAIRAFCRACPKGTSRNGKNYLHAYVACEQKKCPLFAFRNGDPRRIAACLERGWDPRQAR